MSFRLSKQNMKQLLVILILIFMLSNDVLSQQDRIRLSSFKIKITPSTMIDKTPRLRLGVELNTNRKFDYSIDIGIGNNTINNKRTEGGLWNDGYSFFEIRPEVKYVFNRREDYSFYCAAEYFFMNLNSRLHYGVYEKENSNVETFYDQADFYKQKQGVHLKIGTDLIFFKRFDIDIYAGIVMAKRKIDYTNVINPFEGEGPLFVEWLPQPHFFEGENVVFHMTAGIKIGYTIWKN